MAEAGGGAGLGQVNAGVVQAHRGDAEAAPGQRPDAGPHLHAPGNVGDGLEADGRVLVNHHVVHREARPFEQAEPHRAAEFDVPPQGALERNAEALAEAVGGEIGGDDPGGQQEGEGRQAGLHDSPDADVHAPPPVSAR